MQGLHKLLIKGPEKEIPNGKLESSKLIEPIAFKIQNEKLGKMHEPVRNVHAAVPYECDEEEHPPLCKYLMSLLQGKTPLRHVPAINIRKTYFL